MPIIKYMVTTQVTKIVLIAHIFFYSEPFILWKRLSNLYESSLLQPTIMLRDLSWALLYCDTFTPVLIVKASEHILYWYQNQMSRTEPSFTCILQIIAVHGIVFHA